MRVEHSNTQGRDSYKVAKTVSPNLTANNPFAMENGHVQRGTQGINHNGTSRPLSALCKQKTKSFGSTPGHRDLNSSGNMLCTRQLWIFFVLGSVLFITGVVVTVLYFSVRELTTTLKYAEVLPTYVPAAAMAVSGCCVFILFWRRVKLLVILAIVACITTALLNTIAVTLTGTHVIQVMQTLSQCRYYSQRRVCHCTSPYTRSNLNLHYTDNSADFMAYIFEDADNCESIHDTLLQLVYGLCAGYVLGVCLCTGAAILAGLVLRIENTQQKLKKDVYEEVYTVSGGSSIASDSDNEQTLHQDALSSNLTRTTSTTEPTPPNVTIRRCNSLVQEHKPHLQESTDNLLTDTSVESSAARMRQKKRRHKRAMTLHNLDSKQLMLILSLQMRYLQETENLRDLQNQTPLPNNGRRTPNPSLSHTPNPLLQRAPSAPPSQSQYAAGRRTPSSEPSSRVRSPPAYSVSVLHDPGAHSLPNTQHAVANIQGNVEDIPRYVSLPKLPRRSQTPSMKHSRLQTSSPRIPNSSSDPNIIHHLGPDVTLKTDMLVQRHGQLQKSPPEHSYLPSQRSHHGNQAIVGRAHELQAYPARIKTPDGNYGQISSYHRSRTPSASSMTSNSGLRPLPPVRSVSCDNTLQRSREGQRVETRAQQPSNYAEVTYMSRPRESTVRGERDEDLYARPTKLPQILLNDTYVELYPVQENSQNVSHRSLPRPPPPPSPPPYPDFFPPVTDLTRRNIEERRAHDSHRDTAANEPTYGRKGAQQSRTASPNISSQSYLQGNLLNYLCPSHVSPQFTQQAGLSHNHSQTEYPDNLSQPVYDTSGASIRQQQQQQLQLQQQREHIRGQNTVGGNSPANSFRPIDNFVHGGQSPPVREQPGSQVALILHNSDEDSDSEFMETVI